MKETRTIRVPGRAFKNMPAMLLPCLKFTKGSHLTGSKSPNFSGLIDKPDMIWPLIYLWLISYLSFPHQAPSLPTYTFTVPPALQAHTCPR